MSIWELRVAEEVIDRLDLKTDKYEEAHTYFRLRKNLDKKAFDNIFTVRQYKSSTTNVRGYQWWKDESKNLDIEKD
jgi:hypothetical protein